MSTEKQAQGMDPKNEVFQGLAAVLYASEAPVSGSYIDQSRMLVAAADAVEPLAKKSVLDIGCGFGTTTMAIARLRPKIIVSLDNSTQHMDLLTHILHTDDDSEAFLDGLGARDVLGEAAFASTVRFFGEMRREFQGGLFKALGGVHAAHVRSALDLSEGQGTFRAIIGNNLLHWPINQRRSAIMKENPNSEAKVVLEQSWREVMGSFSRVLETGGIVAFLEPKDFVQLDDDPWLESMCEERTTVAHPAIVALQTELNRRLKDGYGIVRQVSKTYPLFQRSQMRRLFEEAGFHLERSTMYEMTSSCPALDYAFVRLPMQLGQVDIPFNDKLQLMRESLVHARRTLTEDVQRLPVRAHRFIWVARKLY